MKAQGFLSAALLCLMGAPSGEAFTQSEKISSIAITGSSDPSLSRYLKVRVGDPLDPETVRSSVLLLSALDLFDEVSAEQETAEDGGVRLIFRVSEPPHLGSFRFVTRLAPAVPDVLLDPDLAKSLERASGLRPHESLREKTIVDTRSRMTTWLRANAYTRAGIEVEVAPDETSAFRDLQVRVMQPAQETLRSSRIDGWPALRPRPETPARPNTPLTEATLTDWKNTLLKLLWQNSYYRAQIRTESVLGDLVFFVTPGQPFDLKLDALSESEQNRARKRLRDQGLSQDAIEDTVSIIESEFLKLGYREVDVAFQETPAGERRVGEFVVNKGAMWRVASVQYLKEGLPYAPDGLGLPSGVPWVDATVNAEKNRIQTYFVARGHAAAEVSVESSGEPANATLIFKIVPGPPATVESVAIEGAPSRANRGDRQATEVVTRQGALFRTADVARDRTALLASLRDDGYIDARVDASADFALDRTRVAVAFHVRPGARVRVGRILIVGLRDTKETVVLRESRLKEGDFLSYQKLLDTQAGLSGTGLFADVQIRELAEEGDVRNLIVEITEGERTTLVPAIGYAQVERLRASLEVTKTNISGRGRTASLFLRGSIPNNGKRVLLSLTEPYAFGRRQTVTMQFYFDDDRTRPAFTFRRTGFQTQTVFPLGKTSNLLVQYTRQRTNTTNVHQACDEVNRSLCDSSISGPSLALVHDTRNDAIEPRRGAFYSTETLLSLPSLGGDAFVKTTAVASRYDEVRAGTVLAATVRLGLSRAFGNSIDVPLPERFFAGGASLLRAFKTDEVGPGRFTPAGVFVPSGGNALVAAALETRIDLTKSWGVQVFAEIGNVFPKVSSVRLGDLREMAGVGVRYRSPFGPLRLDWGFKLDKRPDESRSRLQLGVGYAF